MLTLNHQHHIHSAFELNKYPHWVDAADRQHFATVFDHVLWVCHPVTGIWWPWAASKNEVALLQQIDKGIETLSQEQALQAIRLGLLVNPELVNGRRQDFETAVVQCREMIRTKRYCKLPAITFEAYSDTVNFWRERVEPMLYTDVQVELRRAYHSPQLFRVVHKQLAVLLQRVADEQIKPSYCYLGHYLPGAVLTKHTDRPQCRWNASICFARTADIWPIYVEVEGQAISVEADVGEVIIYQGSVLPHWRDALPSGTSTVTFFHFVPQNFQDELR